MAPQSLTMNTGPRTGRALTRTLIILAILGLLAIPAFTALRGCDEKADANIQHIKLGGKSFFLEIAADEPTRMKGLGGRTKIEPDGGMLFVMPKPVDTSFVMRDCPSDIDIIFVDPNGRITAMHEMKKEDPRGPDEGTVGVIDASPGSPGAKYEARLKKYPSRFPAQFAIEIAPGSLAGPLKGKFKEGDKLDLPLAALKARAK
jgi:uncharacterized protein